MIFFCSNKAIIEDQKEISHGWGNMDIRVILYVRLPRIYFFFLVTDHCFLTGFFTTFCLYAFGIERIPLKIPPPGMILLWPEPIGISPLYTHPTAWPHGSFRVLYKHPEPSRFKEALLKFLKSRTPPPLSQRRPEVAQQTIGNSRMEPILWKAEGNKWVRNGVIVWPCVSYILAVDDSFGVLGFNKIVFDNTEHPNKHNHLEPMIIFSLHAWRWRHWYLSQRTAGKI